MGDHVTALVFPASPTVGDQFPVDNPRWEWTGTRWKSLGARPVAIPDPSEQPIGLAPETAGSSYGLRRFLRDALSSVETIEDDDSQIIVRRSDGEMVGIRASVFAKTSADDPGAFTSAQSFANVAGDIYIRLTNGWAVRIASTAGNWGVDLDGYDVNRMFRWTLTVDTSDNAHKPTYPANWRFPDGEPATTLFEADKRVVLSLEWFPQLEQFIVTLVDSGATPVGQVDDTPPVEEPDPGDPLDETGDTVTSAGTATTPTVNVTPNGTDTLSVTWSHGTFVLFQFRYTATPTIQYQWDPSTTNTSRVVTGLTADVVYRIEVRLYDNVAKVWRAWNVVELAPNATGGATPEPDDPEAPPPDPGDPAAEITSRLSFEKASEVTASEGRRLVRKRMLTFGGPSDFGSWRTPWQGTRQNSVKTADGAIAINASIKNAYDWYQLNYPGGMFSEGAAFNPGPFLSWTLPCNFSPIKDSFPHTGGNIASALDFGKIIRGDYDVSVWQTLGSRIQNSTEGGLTDWQDRVLVNLGHEHTGPWYKGYSGQDDSLIDHPDLVGATNNQWGSTAGALLRTLGETGNLGPLFKASFERAVTQMRVTCPDVIIDITAAGVSAAPGDGSTGNLLAQFNLDAFPDPSFITGCYGYDPYWRGHNRPLYVGPGHTGANPTVTASRTAQGTATESDLANVANWRFNGTNGISGIQTPLEWMRDFAAANGRPIAFWEVGTQYDNPDSSSGITANDNEARIGWKWFIESYLPTVELVRAVYWNAPGDSAAGTTYRLDVADPAKTVKTRAYLATIFDK